MWETNAEAGLCLQQAEKNKEARMWAMFCHLAALTGWSVLPGIGFVVGPLIVWRIKKDKFPFVDEQGREALRFQLTMNLYFVIASLLMFVYIGFVLLPLVMLADVVLSCVAAYRANDGVHYRYPRQFVSSYVTWPRRSAAP